VHDFVTIRGNQDRQIYEASHGQINANPTKQFVLNDLGEEPLSWMKSLPFDNQNFIGESIPEYTYTSVRVYTSVGN
jgi:hypothetical protein